MKTLMKKIVAAACLMAGLSAFATDYTWSSTSTDTKSWQTLANWSVGGEAATDLPTNATDTATFPNLSPVMRTVYLMADKDGWKGNLASVTGNEYWRLVFNPAGDGTYRSYTETFSFANVNGFKGEWKATGGKKTLKLTAASGTQTLPIVTVAGQFAIEVENAATTAEIEHLAGTAGSLKKSGAGDLRVKEVTEAGDLVLELAAGNVQLDGKTKTPLTPDAAVFAKSAVWLDASNRATWEKYTYVDDQSRTRVTNWLDAAGRSVKAEIWDNSGDTHDSHIKNIQPPFISAKQSSTGLPLMDFGTADSASTTLPQALMRLSGGEVQVQEAFFVSEVSPGNQILGHDDDVSFHAGDNYAFTYGEAITNNGGFAHFNGFCRTPELQKNGQYWRVPRPTDAYTPTKLDALQLTDVCFGTGNAKPVRFVASDRVYKSNSGGVRIGEVLLFTEKLTDAERAAVTDYLMRKWFTKYDRNDFDVANAAKGTSITVPEGRVARIGTLRVTGAAPTFTKKGAGTLEIGRVYPEDLTITVEGGDVKLDTVITEGTPSTPSGTPYLWLDANAADVFTKDGDNVTEWKDWRDATKKAKRLNFGQVTAYPKTDTTRVSGKTTLTFPDAAAFQMTTGGGQRETFIAFCYTVTPEAYNVIAEGYRTDRNQSGSYYMFAAPGVGLEGLAGGTFSVDGKPVRPFEAAGTTFVKDQWYVIHLATPMTVDMSRLASNGPRSWLGHVSYGEVITYNTALSPEDRTATIDYLMNKWLGKRHPEYAAPAKDISLAFTGDAAVGSEADATFAEVTGSGTLTKTGAGDATVTAELTDGFTDLAVEGGSLTISKMVVPPDRSVFHFDAMDTASFAKYYIDENGETNVSRWADTRANGVYSYNPGPVNPSGSNWMYMTNPIVRHVTFPDGRTRPILDFLKANGRNVAPTGAGHYLSNVDACKRKVKEAHYIFGDGQNTLRVFHGRYDSDFLRGSGGGVVRTSGGGKVSDDILNGYISVDNKPATGDTYIGGGKFHLVSVAPLSAKDISTLGVDRADQAGGGRFGECIAFTDYLPAKERAYLQGKLMHKWINSDLPDAVWTNELDSVTLADGATLTVDGGAISAPTITGGGTIDATKVYGIANINLTAPDRRTVNGLTVEGEADFAGPVTVNLAGGADLRAGTYTLVSATDFANLDLSQWTLNGAPTKYQYVLKQVGNTVVLEVKSRGLCVIFY